MKFIYLFNMWAAYMSIAQYLKGKIQRDIQHQDITEKQPGELKFDRGPKYTECKGKELSVTMRPLLPSVRFLTYSVMSGHTCSNHWCPVVLTAHVETL